MSPGSDGLLEVVAGVVADPAGRVLVTQRPPGRSRAGSWEFPGGKREAGEAPRDALVRELREELGIEVRLASRLLVLTHAYADGLSVRLDCWRVTQWAGVPRGLDGQALCWCWPAELDRLDLLEADRPLATALVLPSLFVYEPEPRSLAARLRARALAARATPIAWVVPALPEDEVGTLAAGSPDLLCAIDPCAGTRGAGPAVYTSEGLARWSRRDRARAGAIVRSVEEVRAARAAGVDFLLVPDRGLARGEAGEILGAAGLPYYVNVADDSGDPPPPRSLMTPVPLPTGRLWWKQAPAAP